MSGSKGDKIAGNGDQPDILKYILKHSSGNFPRKLEKLKVLVYIL